ncbi:META domain-containing protein [Pseudorhodobacter sp.]|uniref:META domain-containing protein n=1 Tax=Pseudorhodobacter sp. TaxID=1934400 RepID=UPI0026483D19|nr:META domain-containing protein [Pseudorhodobacter sp.]MDN5786158.1 META domain-containing protein [Pseudorhodobacter sp.]
MKRRNLVLAGVLGLGLLGGVAACVGQQGGGMAQGQSLGGEWRVSQINGAAVPAGVEVTLAISGNQVSGSSGCNRYNGGVTQDGQAVKFGPAAMTRMACAPAAMAVEAEFGKALDQISRFDVIDGTLQLYAGDALVIRATR